jgi:hypothetical protein
MNSQHIVERKRHTGHENVENPRKNSRGKEGMDTISGNVIMHACMPVELVSCVYTSHYGMKPRIT